MSLSNRRSLFIAALGVGLLLQASCRPRSTSVDVENHDKTTAATPSESTLESSKGPRLLEHVDPPHKPQTFPLAALQLRQLLTDLSHPTPGQDAELVWSQAKDTIRWIPELGAESELTEATWNQIDQLAVQLESSLGRAVPTSLDANHPIWGLCKQLDALVDQFNQAEAAFLGRFGSTAANEELKQDDR